MLLASPSTLYSLSIGVSVPGIPSSCHLLSQQIMSATAVSGSSGAASIDIITRLKDLLQSQTGKKLLRAHVYTVPLQQQPVAMTSNQKHGQSQSGVINLTSWNMSDYAYKKDPCPFPTRARGLFTSDDRIVVRGYDKFFNVGEVSWTKVPFWSDCDSVEHH